LLEHYQKMEEERLAKIQEYLLAYCSKEVALAKAKGENVPTREEFVKKISKEAEIGNIIATYEPKEKQLEDIPFKKATSKYEKVFQKFDFYYTKGAVPAGFDVETALKSALSVAEDQLDEQTLQMTQSIKKIVTQCWDCKGTTGPDKDQFKKFIEDPRGRKAFADSLNHYRKIGMFSMKEKAYVDIAELMYHSMDTIQQFNDVEAALNLMILSQTFYLDKKQEGKMFLHAGIQSHPFWQRLELWENTIKKAIDDELKMAPVMKESEAEAKMRMDSTIFGKLGTFAHNMLQFNIDKAKVEGVIFGCAKERNLGEPFSGALRVL